ncbi:MAG TPA: immunity 17 family protein [Burkholderiales bacterium]
MPVTLFSWLVGAFVIVAAMLDWNWFFEHPKAKFFVGHFGRGGARLFYAALGCALVVLGFACRNTI